MITFRATVDVVDDEKGIRNWVHQFAGVRIVKMDEVVNSMVQVTLETRRRKTLVRILESEHHETTAIERWRNLCGEPPTLIQ